MDRRSFLQGAAAVAAASALGQAASAASLPNERIRAGFVGVGGRAFSLLNMFSAQTDVEVVAIADIDPQRVAPALKLLSDRALTKPTVHEDFRSIIDDDSIQIVIVGTPDHWHAIPTILACQAGKDVYVEKPDGHNIVEGQRMVAAMRRHDRIVQMGNQARSNPGFLAAMEFIRGGKLGTVLAAKAWENAKQGSIGSPPDGDPPPGVNYDIWLGPAPKRPFNPLRFHGNWRWFFDYGTGDLGNDGVHRIDYALWALDTLLRANGEDPLGMPRTVSAQGGKWYFDDIQEWPDTLQVNYEFERAPRASKGKRGFILSYEMRLWSPYPFHGEKDGAVLYGDQGYIVLAPSRWQAFDGDNNIIATGESTNDATPHVRNFLECVKSRQRPNSDIEVVGHPASLLCHAGNIAWRTGRLLRIDPSTETFIGDDEANALRTRPAYRDPWRLPEV